ncbi:hypothetical protein P691DRAFT_738380 [Macrolepiota fuliginosa MF-IS2]|uniref:DUF6533 domain-containing protein n=1 Tax=Macrolepiota fuliginosa MF-IS2 TaxID=1400762 RepID=A0A9P5X201_9AGAR|nr:hypothetical protein P691DRAFT_738380 [Macrolepiota fuliginosa MF-IS2]
MLTLEMEVVSIWQAPWTLMKVLYLLGRYTPFVDRCIVLVFPLQVVCISFIPDTLNASLLCMRLIYGLLTVIFTLRTWIIWGKRRNIGIGLAIFYMVVWFIVLVPVAIYLRSTTFKASPAPRLLGCTKEGPDMLFSISFTGAIVYDGAMLLLLITRAIISFRSGENSDLLRVIYRDGIVYYIYLFILAVLNLLVFLKLPKDYADLFLSLERVLQSVLACRVVLHIRQQARRIVQPGSYDSSIALIRRERMR